MQPIIKHRIKDVREGNICNFIVKKSVTFCNFPIDERNNLVYNAYKKEHRDHLVMGKPLSKAKFR